jgi:hypothetical protein
LLVVVLLLVLDYVLILGMSRDKTKHELGAVSNVYIKEGK